MAEMSWIPEAAVVPNEGIGIDHKMSERNLYCSKNSLRALGGRLNATGGDGTIMSDASDIGSCMNIAGASLFEQESGEQRHPVQTDAEKCPCRASYS
jgi:hypothetical protein